MTSLQVTDGTMLFEGFAHSSASAEGLVHSASAVLPPSEVKASAALLKFYQAVDFYSSFSPVCQCAHAKPTSLMSITSLSACMPARQCVLIYIALDSGPCGQAAHQQCSSSGTNGCTCTLKLKLMLCCGCKMTSEGCHLAEDGTQMETADDQLLRACSYELPPVRCMQCRKMCCFHMTVQLSGSPGTLCSCCKPETLS